MTRRIDNLIIILLTALLLNGCGDTQQKSWDTLESCKEKNTELSMQVQQLQDQNTQLTDQLATLSVLDSNTQFKAVNTLEKICIAKRTSFYDKDKDGINDTLVVYLEPVDTVQDTIKAIGQLTIELWDLNIPEDNTVAKWTIEPDVLHTAWGGNIFASYYRIKLPLEITPEQGKEYTLKVRFTDYLGGNVLTDQKVLSTQ